MVSGFSFTGRFAIYNVIKCALVTSLDRDVLILFDTKEEADLVGKAMFIEGGYEVIEFVA